MSESPGQQLLGQHISMITKYEDMAMYLKLNDESYKALEVLQTLIPFLYNDGTREKLDAEIENSIKRIIDIEKRVSTTESQARAARIEELQNMEAKRDILNCFSLTTAYMQRVGYYLMMNKGWDNRIIPTSTMKPQVEPPKTKTYLEKMPSEIL
jgi:hypothetical protein